MREKAKVDELTFALSADVTEAHRQVPIHPDDWHYLGCQVIPGGDVFVNTVGTFGIASASYYWSRVAGAMGVYYNISVVILQLHGICLSRTTVYWNPGALGTVLDSYSSLCSVRPIIGPESLAPSDDCCSVFLDTRPRHGTCLSRMTVCWNLAGLGIGQDFYFSSCCVLWLAFRYPGIKLAAGILSSGSALRYC